VSKLNSLQFGWIDYSGEHRNKVLAVLHALSAPEAVDELGIGLIRDGFADVLFPGTSTIQTRAKYFFIVPYLLMELEKERHSSPEQFLKKLSDAEIALIDVLNKEEASGVIGVRAGKDLKRRPSSIYWNGLRTFGMFKYESLSLENYAKAVVSMKKSKHTAVAFGHDELDHAESVHGEYSDTFWKCLIPNANWKDSLTIELSYEEANYLLERIVKADRSQGSMLAFLLKQDHEKVKTIDNFEAFGEAFTLEGNLLEDYMKAKKFSEFISGANIRYNVILSGGRNSVAVEKWEEWLRSPFVQYEFPTFPFHTIIERLKIRNSRLVRFLDEWRKAVLSGDEDRIDHLIIRREIELKSKERAKLHNSKVYSYIDGDWVGTEKLHYRFRNGKAIISDILAGLEAQDA
jgi:hypothetical protein